MIIRSDW